MSGFWGKSKWIFPRLTRADVARPQPFGGRIGGPEVAGSPDEDPDSPLPRRRQLREFRGAPCPVAGAQPQPSPRASAPDGSAPGCAIGPLCGWQRQRQLRACAPAALSQRVAPAKARKAAEVAVVRMHHRLVVDRQSGDVRIGEQGALEHAGFREAR